MQQKKLERDASLSFGRAAAALWFAQRYFRGKGGYGWEWTNRKARLVTAGVLAGSGVFYLAVGAATLLLVKQEKKNLDEIERIFPGFSALAEAHDHSVR